MIQDEPRLEDTGRGFTVRYKGRYLYSTRDPLSGPRHRAAETPLQPGSLVFVPSVGLGYGLSELLGHLPERCHVLCVETDTALMALALSSGLPLPRSDRLSIVRLDTPGQAAAVLRSLGLWRFRRLVPLPLCRGRQLHQSAYRGIQAALEEEIRLYWQNKITLVEMSRLWLKNLFTNLALLPDAAGLDSQRVLEPILVTGAGPSLEQSIREIQRIRDRVRLLATDTSLPTLAASGIAPDWVCVLESQVHNLGDFVPAFCPSMRLLCDLTASPTVLRRFPKRTFFSSRFYPLELFSRLERFGLLPAALPPLGSVGVSAVQLALRLTRGPVLFAGLDFAFQPGKTHARGAPSHLARLISGGRFHPPGMGIFEALIRRPRLKLQGREGSPVVSDLVLRSYALQLQRLVEDAGRVYDLGGQGLPCGAATFGSTAAVDELLDRWAAANQPGRVAAEQPTVPPAVHREAVRAFCLAEAAILRRTEDRLRELLTHPALPNGDATPTPEELPPWLKEVEYLVLPLPESDPAQILSSPVLPRILAGVRYFEELLDRVSALLEAEAGR
jgi:hypothetical protein